MKDFIIDFETLGNTPDAAVIDCAIIVFDPSPEKTETFDELTRAGLKVKFDLSSQRDKRTFSKSTIAWWKDQSPEARKNLAPNENDVDVDKGIKLILDFLIENGVNRRKSLGWCRGQSFDFPIMVNLIRSSKLLSGIPENEIDTFDDEPCFFWNQRDIRTAIEAYSLTRGLSMCPLPNGTLNGFVAHDSIHDCAKDILMLKYAQRYALSLEDVPENPDPLSIKNR